MHVPSGKIKIGGLFGSLTCCFNLYKKKIYNENIKNLQKATNLCATADLSLASALSNQICGDALAKALCKTPRKPPCL